MVDFEDPAHPVLIDAIDDWGVPVLGEDRLYRLTSREVAVHRLGQGLPVSGGLGPLGGAAEKLLFDGEIGVLGDGSGGLVTYDFQDPDDPIELGRVLVEGYVDDVAVADGYAFLAADEGGFVVVDYRNPGAPRVVAEHSLAGRALDIALDGDLALVTRRNPSTIRTTRPGSTSSISPRLHPPCCWRRSPVTSRRGPRRSRRATACILRFSPLGVRDRSLDARESDRALRD